MLRSERCQVNEKVMHRQQIERDYHNSKYNNNSSLEFAGSMDYAYEFFKNKMSQFALGRVLDFGCGDGWASIMLAKKGYHVYGIDISVEMVNKSRKLAQELGVSDNAVFKEMTGEDLQFQDDFFDSVFGSAVLHHTDLEMALNSIHRVLKPGGMGLFIEPMNQNIFLKMWRVLTPWRRSPAEKALTNYEIGLIKKKFPAARLTYFKFASIFSSGLILIFPNNNLVHQINKIFEHVDNVIIKNFPWLGRYCAVVVIELLRGNKDECNEELITCPARS